MKVICIKEPTKFEPHFKPIVSVGSPYQVKEIQQDKQGNLFYELQEHEGVVYLSSLFARVSDIDETDLVKQRQLDLIYH